MTGLLLFIAVQLSWLIYRMECKLWSDKKSEEYWKLVTPPEEPSIKKYFTKRRKEE